MCKTFEDLEMYLLGGGEVEFYYRDELYAISHNTQGWYLSKYGKQEYQTFKDCEDLLENAVVDSRKLSEVWDEVRV